jgi:PAS domain S-box-containing protein
MKLIKKTACYNEKNGRYSVKFRILPYAILVFGILLTFCAWRNESPILSSGIMSYATFILGFSVSFFVFGLLLLYINAYDWAVTMTDATTRQLKRNAEELTRKVKIIEQKNENLVEAKEKMSELMSAINVEKSKIAKENVRMEAILESIGDGLIVCDKEGVVEKSNEATEKMIGWKNEEIIGKKLFHMIGIQDEEEKEIPRELRPLRNALETRRKVTSSLLHPIYFVRKDKSKFPVAIVATPVILNGKIEGAIMVFRDITNEWDVDRSKTEFVSLASHQLRTPLSTIGWYSEMLLAGDAGKLSKEQEEYLKEIYNGNRRMVELVNSLLNVSRIELGTLAVESELTDFISLCESVLKELTPTFETKRITISKKYDKRLSLILADPKLVRIIFQNFLTNAIKYTPDKGKISVEISRQDPDVLIKVSDNGYGIPEHQKDRIFSKLFRADNAREKETEGTGLGLYIVKLVVDSAKGEVWFESEENKGTTFFVRLPLSGMANKVGTKSLMELNEAAPVTGKFEV